MIKEKINDLMKEAMKSGDKIKLETLRSIRAAFIEFDKSGSGKELTEEEEIKIINSLTKKRKESIEIFEKANRLDLAEKEKKELEILLSFLPQQLSEEEIAKKLDEIIAQVGAKDSKDFGKVMGVAMKEFKGRADGKVVQSILKSKLEANASGNN
ncbi:MAG: GatB/YqeY domain-containing protein [Ignavibacteria bacterium]